MKRIDTLRVAVTDRCNLHCFYCRPAEGERLLPASEILSFEELERVVRAAAAAGVSRVRLTGGEPLVRKGIEDLTARLASVPGIADLALTTNGVLLADLAPTLKRAGLKRVTVSLDSLRPERFEKITGKPLLARVLAGISAARQAGLEPLKVNVVMVPGVNEDEAPDFARLAAQEDLEVRFIEQMPLAPGPGLVRCGIPARDYIPTAELRRRIEKETGPLRPGPDEDLCRPARVFVLRGGRGRVGFIAPLSEPFCRWCSRLRLTAEGKIRLCLAQEQELDIKGPLRTGAGEEELRRLFLQAAAMKPEQETACFVRPGRFMAQIGG